MSCIGYQLLGTQQEYADRIRGILPLIQSSVRLVQQPPAGRAVSLAWPRRHQ